jgi:hypothetical protein
MKYLLGYLWNCANLASIFKRNPWLLSMSHYTMKLADGFRSLTGGLVRLHPLLSSVISIPHPGKIFPV